MTAARRDSSSVPSSSTCRGVDSTVELAEGHLGGSGTVTPYFPPQTTSHRGYFLGTRSARFGNQATSSSAVGMLSLPCMQTQCLREAVEAEAEGRGAHLSHLHADDVARLEASEVWVVGNVQLSSGHMAQQAGDHFHARAVSRRTQHYRLPVITPDLSDSPHDTAQCYRASPERCPGRKARPGLAQSCPLHAASLQPSRKVPCPAHGSKHSLTSVWALRQALHSKWVRQGIELQQLRMILCSGQCKCEPPTHPDSAS